MKKLLVRFILVQCILLLHGYSHPYAHASQRCAPSSIVLDNSTASSNCTENLNLRFPNSGKNFEIEIAEIEEDKGKFSYKRHFADNSFTLLFPDHIQDHLFACINKSEFAKSVPELASNNSYITLRVFRI